jgi:broad specificity phosphatase PhoE
MVGGGWGNTIVQQTVNNIRHGASNNNTREGGMSTWCGIATTMQGEEQAITMQGKQRKE